jgi:hypothetical protein
MARKGNSEMHGLNTSIDTKAFVSISLKRTVGTFAGVYLPSSRRKLTSCYLGVVTFM